MTTIRLRKPHSQKQADMITYPGNVVTFAGRRYGKTDGYVQRLYYWAKRNPGLYWWAGLSWQSASMKRAWRETTIIARQILAGMNLNERDYINRSRHEIIIPGLCEIWFRTADNPESMAGEGVRGIVCDEFSLMAERVWSEYIQATLLDYNGWVAFGGVPKGRNWAAALWAKAAELEGWLQIHATSYENPFIPSERIDRIKEIASAEIFRQEYMAEILEGFGAVFRNVDQAACLQEARPQDHAGHPVYFGVDWGKQNDFTVIVGVCRKCNHVVLMDRFNQIDYAFQRQRLEAHVHRWKPYSVLPERNSMGEPIIEELYRAGVPVGPGADHKLGFMTTAMSKPPLIEELSLAIEKGELKILNNPIMTGELLAYERQVSKSGRPSYNAPEGAHDDVVMALALAWNAAATSGINLG